MNADNQRCGKSLSLAFATALLLWVSAVPAPGQGYEVRNWHIGEGLPSPRVTAIAQTPDDYLWVGTPRGLARFDGVRFMVFAASSGSGLGDARIVSLHTDREGTLWVGTLDGNLMRWQGDRFTAVTPPVPWPLDADKRRIPDLEPRDPSSRDKECFLVSDQEGGLWWDIPGKGCARLKDGRWTVLTQTNGLPRRADVLSRDGEGRIWAAVEGKQLHRFAIGRADLLESSVQLSGRISPTLAPAVGHGLWVTDQEGWASSSSGRLFRLASGPVDHPATFSNSWPIPPRTEVTAMHEDRAGRLWAGTRNGLCYFDAEGRWQKLEVRGPSPLGQARLTCLFEDRQGNLWTGALHDGLFRVTPQPIIALALPSAGLSARCLCVTRDDVVWVGTAEDGVFRFQGGEFTAVSGDWGAAVPEIQSLFQDSRSNLWAGTSIGLFRLQNGVFSRFKAPATLSRNVQVIFEDRAGRVWFGGRGAATCLHAGEFSVAAVADGADVRAFAEDGAGDLWIGTLRHGLFRLPHGGQQTAQRVENYPERDARSLLCDRAGILWAGGDQSGLFRQVAEGFQQFSTADGFPSDTIYSILSDRHGNLWMGTGNGIVGISSEVIAAYRGGANPLLPWKHLSVEQGLNTPRCYARGQPSANATSDGRLWFPNEDHLAVLDPSRSRFENSIRSVLLEAVLADGKALPLTSGEVLHASSGTRRFEFQYTALDLTSPSSVRFRYKLEGMDTGWIEAGALRAAQYSQLPPGDYDFQVMATGGDAQWREAAGKIRLTVVPRVWERRWVQLLATALLVSLAGGSVAWRHRRRMELKLARLEAEQKVEAERRRIARDLHDELGSCLTGIAVTGAVAMRQDQSPEDLRSQFGAVMGQVRDVINGMDEAVWTISPKNDSLPSLAAFLGDYTERFVAPTGISHRLDLDPQFPPLRVSSQARHNLLLAVKEALNNAVRHAQPRIIRLKVHARDGWLEVEVADDGLGFEVQKAQAKGRGLANLEERMKMINGRVAISSQPDQGTTVVFSMPLTA